MYVAEPADKTLVSHEVCACACMVSTEETSHHNHKQYQAESGIMRIRLASKVMSAKAIFWYCTHTNTDSLAPELSIPGEMC